MNERPFRTGIYYGLPRRRETPAVIGAKFLHSLDALSRIDPLFAKWNVLDRPALASLPLAVARPRIATIVENNVVRDDDGQPEPELGIQRNWRDRHCHAIAHRHAPRRRRRIG